MKMGNIARKLGLLKDTEARIIIQGMDNAGKTTLLYKLKLDKIIRTIPTVGFNMEAVRYGNTSMICYDLGGGQKFGPMRQQFYQPATKAFIFVVDSADKDRLYEAKEELDMALQNDELKDVHVLVLANKQDNPKALDAAEIAQYLQLSTLKQKCTIVPTCFLRGEGIEESMEWLCAALKGEQVQTINTNNTSTTEQRWGWFTSWFGS